MNNQIFVPTEERFRKIQREIFEKMLATRLPKILRRSTRKQYLTTKDLRDDFGISYELQSYYRNEGMLSYSQESRKIWYNADDVDNFMAKRKIEAKK